MAQVLRHLPSVSDPNLLIGLGTSDDAAVYRLNDDIALVQTVDFFPPIVDDPFAFGEIAAANSFSDVYAMGARPLLALNIVGFPVDLPRHILGSILEGGASKAREAGALIVGGHTVDDKEPKYGMAVTGLISPGKQVSNAGAQPGDALVLTKPIGTGIITTAAKQGIATPGILDAAVAVMARLNDSASQAMMSIGVNACVDVTGFGLLGHLRPIVVESGVSARVRLSDVPVLAGARELVEQGVAPGGTVRNLDSLEGVVEWDAAVTHADRLLLADAQTSGGLMIAVRQDRLDSLLHRLGEAGVKPAVVIGEVMDDVGEGCPRIFVSP